MPPDTDWSSLIGVLFNNGAWGILVFVLLLDARYQRSLATKRDEQLIDCYEKSISDAKSKRGLNPEGDTQARKSKTFAPNISEAEKEKWQRDNVGQGV